MRIDRLDLIAHGPFTDLALDLSAGSEGLHLIYGPNEAGKSSALRAVRDLLYGIPPQSSDNFIHKHTSMRVGARLRLRDGRTLAFVRRKGTKETLLAEDGKSKLADSALADFLGPVDLGLFKRLFGIDHAELVDGGRAVVEGKGDVGSILFAAGAGLGNLRVVRKQLEDEVAGLFKPAGTLPVINKDLADLKNRRDALKAVEVPGARWVEQDRALAGALVSLDAADQALNDARATRARLDRARRSLPVLAARAGARAELDAMGSVPILRDGFANDRLVAATARAGAARAAEENRIAVAEARAGLDRAGAADPILDAAEAVERLRDDLADRRKGQADRPNLAGKLDQARADASARLLDIRPGLALDDAETLRLDRPRQVALREHGARFEALCNRLDVARTALDARDDQLRTAEAGRPAPPDPIDLDPIQAAVRNARRSGDLDDQADRAGRALDQARLKAELALAKLPGWSGSLDATEALAVPDPAAVERAEANADGLANALKAARNDLDRAEAELIEANDRLQRSQPVDESPTELDPPSPPRERTVARWPFVAAGLALAVPLGLALGWEVGPATAIVGALLAALTLRPWLARRAPAGSAPPAIDLADRIRREAVRAAELTTLRADLRKAVDRAESLRARHLEAASAVDGDRTDWAAAWVALGVEPKEPRAMRTWLELHRKVVELAELAREAGAEGAAISDRISGHRDDLQRTLARLEQPPSEPDERLSARLDRADAALARLKAVAEARRGLAEARDELARAVDEMAGWRTTWAAHLAPLGLPPEASPASANEVVDRIRELLDLVKEIRTDAARLDALDREADRFDRNALELVDRLAPELADGPTDRAAQALVERLARARSDRIERRNLAERLELAVAKLEAGRPEARAAEARLQALAQEAGAAGPADLPDIERADAEAKQLRARLRGLDDELIRLGDGLPIDDLRREAAGADPDDLARRIETLDAQIKELEAEGRALREQIGASRTRLDAMDGGPASAEVAEEVEGLKAKIEAGVDRYARAKLASAILAEAIARHRRRNQGAVLDRAGQLFARLTAGAFAGLDVEDAEGDGDESRLIGVRTANGGAGARVGTGGMSEGTADQLYLALRLAGLENHLAAHPEPFPLIVDDLLILFDNRRAAATLALLAELSLRIQILFFTHHEHLLDLAAAHLPPDLVHVHRLPDVSTFTLR